MSKQCQGTTKQANQCKFDAQPNSLYCRIHSGSGTPKSKLKVGASIKLNKETHPPQESQQSVEIWIPETLIKLYEDNFTDDWMGDTPQDRKRFERLVEKFTDLVSNLS